MKRDNNIVVDLEKCQWAKLVYRNQYGQTRKDVPTWASVRNETLRLYELAYPHPEYPKETELERAERLGLVDEWTPELTLKLTANEYLVYVGDKALSIWKTWNAKIFGSKAKT
jgi:hypothetical protein